MLAWYGCLALHRDGSSVFEVALHPLHPSPPLAVSGGEDDLAFLFDTTTGKEVVRLSGHTDSVVAVSFSEFFVSFFPESRLRELAKEGREDFKLTDPLPPFVFGFAFVQARTESSLLLEGWTAEFVYGGE